MKILSITLLVLILSPMAQAKETLSVATQFYWSGLAYNSQNPAQKHSYLGLNMSRFVNEAKCQTVELTPNPQTGSLEWKSQEARRSDGSWFGPTDMSYELTIRKERNGEYYLYSNIKFNGTSTLSGSTEKSTFVAMLTGATLPVALLGAGNDDKVELTPVLLVKTCQ